MQEMQHKITGDSMRELFARYESPKALKSAMDKRRTELESEGYRFVRRVKIGRNAPCPCNSGLKFKRCCIQKFEGTAGGSYEKIP